MGLVGTTRAVVGASICAVAHGLMLVGIACVGDVPDPATAELPDEDDTYDAVRPRVFEHTEESRRMVAEGMPRHEGSVVSAGSHAGLRARVRR